MDATIEEFGKLYPAYATLYFKDISHAKEQIVGTLLRLQAQLSILQSLPEWEYHGVIVAYEPTGSQLVVASKLTSRDASFSRYLCAKKHKLISSSIANKYYAPLALPDVNIHYVAVPDRQNEYQVDLRELLRL